MCGAPIEGAGSSEKTPAPQPSSPSSANTPSYSAPSYSSTPSYHAPSYTSYAKAGEVDSYSKKALAFGLVSFILMVVSFIIGGVASISRYSSYYDYSLDEYVTYANPLFIIAIPVAIGLNVAGLIFGIVGKVQANKASTSSGAEKAGNIFSILGIIFNALGLALIAIIAPLLIMNFWSGFGLYNSPYYYY